MLTTGYELRAPTRDDLDAVAEVLIADRREEGAEPVLDADFLRDEWNRSGFDLASDAWVAVDPGGAIVGYGQVVLEDPTVVESWGVVHPVHRGRGIGSSFLDRIEARASDLPAGAASTRVRHAIDAGDRAAASMLEARGLRPVRHFWHMQIDLDGSLEPGAAPDGIEIGAVDPDANLAAVHTVLDEAFSEDWGYHPEPFDRWAADHARGPSFDPSLWLLARDRGTPVGALTAHLGTDRGWVGEVVVLEPYRGLGIAAALLRRSFGAFAQRGFRSVLLNVDAENPTGATALYERAGMRVVNRWDLWERSTGASTH